jgi:hypothetical protein
MSDEEVAAVDAHHRGSMSTSSAKLLARLQEHHGQALAVPTEKDVP